MLILSYVNIICVLISTLYVCLCVSVNVCLCLGVHELKLTSMFDWKKKNIYFALSCLWIIENYQLYTIYIDSQRIWKTDILSPWNVPLGGALVRIAFSYIIQQSLVHLVTNLTQVPIYN